MNSNFPSSDISNLIRTKERELHEIHDMRFSSLEKMISERDSLLLESSRRFEQLKDDFTYNLALLEARDQEIKRLGSVNETLSGKLDVSDQDRKSANEKISQLQTQSEERTKHFLDEKASNKVIQRFLCNI